jgi:hypothetical protein
VSLSFHPEKTGKGPENTTSMSTRNGTSSKPSSENANTSGGSSRVSTKFFGKRKHFRRVFARFDKTKDAYAAFITIPSALCTIDLKHPIERVNIFLKDFSGEPKIQGIGQ